MSADKETDALSDDTAPMVGLSSDSLILINAQDSILVYLHQLIYGVFNESKVSSFTGCINNVVIKLPINYDSHMLSSLLYCDCHFRVISLIDT